MIAKIKRRLKQFSCIHENVRKIGSDNQYVYVECTLCGKKERINRNDVIYEGNYIYEFFTFFHGIKVR